MTKGIVRSAVGVLLVAIVLYSFWQWQLNRSVDGRIAKLSAEGLPTDGSGPNDFHPAVPDGQDNKSGELPLDQETSDSYDLTSIVER